MDDQAPLQALPHCELRYGLKLGLIPAADLVAEHLRLKVFAFGVMQDRIRPANSPSELQH